MSTALEDLSREKGLVAASDRAFGFVFTVLTAVIGLWPLVRSEPPRSWALIASAVFLFLALALPRVLNPLNRLWTGLAILLNRVMNPIATGLIFIVAFFPMALLLRVMKKDLLRLQFDESAKSYWIERNPPGPAPDGMANQF